MCGRYHMGDGATSEELQEIIHAMNRGAYDGEIKTTGEIFPTDVVPVIASNRSRKPAVFPMAWGYTLPNGRRVINARSETAKDRPLFRDGMTHRRCAIPASHYFEWTHGGAVRDKYAIRPEADSAIYMAGLYRLEQCMPTFVILTRAPSKAVSFLHDRMPVLLSREQIPAWIDPGRDPAPLLLQALGDVRVERIAPETEQVRMTF